jgi:hypothetical protein
VINLVFLRQFKTELKQLKFSKKNLFDQQISSKMEQRQNIFFKNYFLPIPGEKVIKKFISALLKL